MNYWIRPILSMLAAACGAVCIHSLLSWVLNRPPSISRSLKEFVVSPAEIDEAPLGTPAAQDPPGLCRVRPRCQRA